MKVEKPRRIQSVTRRPEALMLDDRCGTVVEEHALLNLGRVKALQDESEPWPAEGCSLASGKGSQGVPSLP